MSISIIHITNFSIPTQFLLIYDCPGNCYLHVLFSDIKGTPKQ